MPTCYPIQTRSNMLWKNGGGSTTEILVWPPGADFAAFDWRISLARIATPGPFSSFPDIDRTLALVSGPGVDLQMEDGERRDVALRQPQSDGSHMPGAQDVVQFRGEARVVARLVDGESTDFNVMTRRSACRHAFARLQLPAVQGQEMQDGQEVQHGQTAGLAWLHDAPHSLLFVAALDAGDVLICRNGMREERLQQHDCLHFDHRDARDWQLQTQLQGAATLFAVHVYPL